MNIERIDYSRVQRFEDYIEQLNVANGIECANLVRDLSLKMSYLPRVTSVASGVGHCVYEAKLKEMLGIKEVVSSSFPGKGRFVHHLLAIASLETFAKNSPPSEDMVKYFEGIAHELKKYDVYSPENDEKVYKDSIETAADLFTSLLAVKDTLFRTVGIDPDAVRPVVEQQMYDYDLHMLGVPDLVLEDPKNRKAVVVEWKSYRLDMDQPRRKSVSSYEKAQVVAYAMLEARRLGYKISEERSGEPSVHDAIAGKLTEKGIEDIRVLPAIIRPGLGINKRLTIPPHPALSTRGDLASNYKKFRELMGEIYVTAHYLAFIVTNFSLYGYRREDFEDCSRVVNGQKRIAFLWAPPKPIPRGKPSAQDSSWHCSVCKVREECKFYIGERHINYFQKMMWSIRYSALADKERLLWPFRAVFELSRFHPSRATIVEKLKKGYSLEWDGSYVRFTSNGPKSRFSIFFSSRDRYSFKIDVVDRLYYDEDKGVFVGVRKARDYEMSSSRKIYHPHVLEESTPIILYANDNTSAIPLSINMTGAVHGVSFETDKEGDTIVKYFIHIPSPALSFQEVVFKKYLEAYPEMFTDVIIMQTGVDLTHIDLVTIDALQRVIGKKLEEIKDKDKKKKIEQYYKILEKQKNWLDFETEFGPELVSENILRLLHSGD